MGFRGNVVDIVLASASTKIKVINRFYNASADIIKHNGIIIHYKAIKNVELLKVALRVK